MTTQNNFIYGFEIEGFGTYAEYNLGETLRLSTETLSGVTASPATYARGLAALPKKISTTCEVLRGSTTQSTMQILIDRLDVPDVTVTRYSQAALSFFWGARPKPFANLGEPITAGTTSFDINLIAGETVPVAGDLVYLAREVMVVTAVAGAGSTRTIDVARGVLASDAVPHELDDTEMFFQNPVKLDRKVTLYEYDPWTDTETARWRGIVEGIDLSDGTQVLCVTCRDLLGTISKRRVGRERWEGNVDLGMETLMVGGATIRDSLFLWSAESYGLVDYVPFYPTVPAGFLPGTEQYSTLSIDVKAMCLEIDGQAVAVRTRANAPAPEPGFVSSYRHQITTGMVTKISGPQPMYVDKRSSMAAQEILVCDRDSPLCYFKNSDNDPDDHPAVIMLNVVTSTGEATWTAGGSHTAGSNGAWDWLPGAWGLAIPVAWIDTAAFTRLQTRYPTAGLRARAMYLGGGGADGSAMDLLADLAQAMNCYLYMTDDARISIRRLADPGTGNTDFTLTAADIAWMDNEGDEQGMTDQKPIYAIALECAARGPGGKPGQILDAGIMGQKWIGRMKFHAVKDKLDSTLIYGDPVYHTLFGEEIEQIARTFAWRYAYCIDRLPQYRMRLVHGSALVMPGQWILLSHPFFYDNDSLTRGITNHRCLVLDGDWDIETGAQELVIVDVSPVTGADTLVSPAWTVTAATSTTSFTVSDSVFAGGSGDRAFFVSGATYKIDLWTADGQLRSTDGPTYATAFNNGTGVVTLNAAWTASAVALTPAAGNVVRVADYDNATGWQAQDYTWLGDSNGQLGAANDSAGRWDV